MASGFAIGIRISLGGARYPDPCRLDRLIARERTTQINLQAHHYTLKISGVSGVGHYRSSRPIPNHWILLSRTTKHHRSATAGRAPRLTVSRARPSWRETRQL